MTCGMTLTIPPTDNVFVYYTHMRKKWYNVILFEEIRQTFIIIWMFFGI